MPTGFTRSWISPLLKPIDIVETLANADRVERYFQNRSGSLLQYPNETRPLPQYILVVSKHNPNIQAVIRQHVNAYMTSLQHKVGNGKTTSLLPFSISTDMRP
jgi:hypothetical protein